MENKAVFKLVFNYGRQGELTGIFVDTKDRVKTLVESGVEVYFGEVLGKHSEVYGPIASEEIIQISDSPEVVALVEEHGLSNGYNPFHYGTLDGEFDTIGEYVDSLLGYTPETII